MVFWISAGAGAARGAFTLHPIAILDKSATASLALDLLWLFLLFAPGAAFGAAFGVLLGRRGQMAILGLVFWPIVMCGGAFVAATYLAR